MMENKSKILIYGAGVIGSIYAIKFANAGHDVSVYARGSRLHDLNNKGLLYNEKNLIRVASVTILSKLKSTDTFDYIFVTVRYEQVEKALAELAGNNNSPNIVTMANNPKGYSVWEKIIGKGKLIPAFAGAGGSIEAGVLHFQLTPRIIQSATFGEPNGTITDRVKSLAKIFKSSKIPYSITKNMDAWQKSHLAMVTVLANGIYFDGGNNYTTAKNKQAIKMMSRTLKSNFNALNTKGIPITPSKLNIFRICPLWMMNASLRILYNTKFAETLISCHALNAREEMTLLDKAFKETIHT